MIATRLMGLAVVVVVVSLTGWPGLGRGLADENSPMVSEAKALIKANAKTILFFAAGNTYQYTGVGFNEYRELKDGFELTYTIECKSWARFNSMRLAFVFDQHGKFDYCKVVRYTTHWTPFADAVSASQLKAMRSFVLEHPQVSGDRKLERLCDQASPRNLCDLYLILEQRK